MIFFRTHRQFDFIVINIVISNPISRQSTIPTINPRTINILILGVGCSGKTVLVSQIAREYLDRYTHKVRLEYIFKIRSNIFIDFANLARYAQNIGTIQPENEAILQDLLSIENIENYYPLIDNATIHQYQSLWSDPIIQTAWKHRNECLIRDNLEYFMNRLTTIHTKQYCPSVMDIFQSYYPTSGIGWFDITHPASNRNIKIIEVGGIRSERKNWIRHYEDVDGIIFTISLGTFDRKITDNNQMNELEESLQVYETIVNSSLLRNVHINLILTKKDMFRDKILHNSEIFQNLFPQYNGPDRDPDVIEQWIIEQFHARDHRTVKYGILDVSSINLLDNKQFKKVYNQTQDAIIAHVIAKGHSNITPNIQ